MECVKVIVATLLATSAMTLFSYIISESFKKLYKEPLLLQFLMSSFNLKLSRKQKAIAGWVIHYLIGLAFVILYLAPIWMDLDWYRINLLSGVVFGGIIGVVGIVCWEIMFRLSPNDPPLNKMGYYLQLFLAHIIFGLTTVAVVLGFDWF